MPGTPKVSTPKSGGRKRKGTPTGDETPSKSPSVRKSKKGKIPARATTPGTKDEGGELEAPETPSISQGLSDDEF